jgi:hypothetical protein
MNSLLPIKPQLPKGDGKKGVILLVSVIVLAGIILVLMVSFYFSINAIRRENFLLPKSGHSFANAEGCLAIALAKLKVSPAYNTKNKWEEFKEGSINCQYLVEEESGEKIIKTKGSHSNFLKKIIVKLKNVYEGP